jgi:hypothetical protein
MVEEGIVAWNLLIKRNEYDLELISYERVLFAEQRFLFSWLHSTSLSRNSLNYSDMYLQKLNSFKRGIPGRCCNWSQEISLLRLLVCVFLYCDDWAADAELLLL